MFWTSSLICDSLVLSATSIIRRRYKWSESWTRSLTASGMTWNSSCSAWNALSIKSSLGLLGLIVSLNFFYRLAIETSGTIFFSNSGLTFFTLAFGRGGAGPPPPTFYCIFHCLNLRSRISSCGLWTMNIPDWLVRWDSERPVLF